MPGKKTEIKNLLFDLTAAEVEFVVGGGVCAVLHGADLTTWDLDLIYSRAGDNLDRLARALDKIDTFYRLKPEARPDAAHLDGPDHHNLMTKYGPLDLLGATVGNRGYAELIGHTEAIVLGPGKVIHILDLPTLIQIKEELGRDTDRATLPVLRHLLEEKERK